MAGSTVWTRPRSPTFCERMRLTYALFYLRLPMPTAWLMALWSIGTSVSFSPINQLPAKLHIVSGNGRREVTVTIDKVTVP